MLASEDSTRMSSLSKAFGTSRACDAERPRFLPDRALDPSFSDVKLLSSWKKKVSWPSQQQDSCR